MKEEDNSTLLKELLQSSRNLPKRSSELGNIQLNLSEIKRQTNELRKDQLPHEQYTKAHYLLLPSGITVEDIESDLNSIEHQALEYYHNHTAASAANSKAYTSESAVAEGDIRLKKDENVLIAIEQSLSGAAQDFDNFINSNISIDWKERKRELRKSFQIYLNNGSNGLNGSNSSNNLTNTARINHPLAKSTLTWKSKDKNKNSIFNRGEFADVKAPSVAADLVNPTVSYLLRQRFETHAEIVYNLNEHRQEREGYPISVIFNDLTRNTGSAGAGMGSQRAIHETWKIVDSLCKHLEEKQFDKTYNKINSPEFDAVNLRKQIVANSKSLLELQFLDYINENYRTQIKLADGSGVALKTPSNLEKISFFLESKLKRKVETTGSGNNSVNSNSVNNSEWKLSNLSIVNGIPIWATIFYLLRAGLYQDALSFTLANRENFQKLERNFPVYLKSFVGSGEHRISQDLNERLHLEFNQYFKHLNKENDPYRYAVYKIIGRCDLTRKQLPHITSSIEDWLWVHLCFTQEDGANVQDSHPIYERYTLLDLQKTVVQLGADNFNGASNNSLYLQVLTFVGLYELAVKFCYSVNEVDAVHLAIGLAYYGLIRPTTEITDSLVVVEEENHLYYLNFAALLISYTRTFKISDPKVACEYLVLVCLTNKDICHDSLRKLVLETREFAMLLGSISKNGVRVPGLIERRKRLLALSNEEEFFNKITKQALARADEESRYQESILLYQLSKEYNTVIQIVNKLLGELIYNTELDKAFVKDANDIISVLEDLSTIYNVNPEISDKIDRANKETCSKLLKFIELRNYFVVKNWSQVLKVAEELKVVPIFGNSNSTDQNSTTAVAKTSSHLNFKTISQDFIKLDDAIVRNVPSLLIIIMTSLIQILKQLQNSSFHHLNQLKIEQLTNYSRDCMIFAGLIEYKMPKEIYKTLISLESML